MSFVSDNEDGKRKEYYQVVLHEDQPFTQGKQVGAVLLERGRVDPEHLTPIALADGQEPAGKIEGIDANGLALCAGDGLFDGETQFCAESPNVGDIARLIAVDAGSYLVRQDVFWTVHATENRMIAYFANVCRHIIDQFDLELNPILCEDDARKKLFVLCNRNLPCRVGGKRLNDRVAPCSESLV
jgi:hypothetical protein